MVARRALFVPATRLRNPESGPQRTPTRAAIKAPTQPITTPAPTGQGLRLPPLSLMRIRADK